MIIVTGGAGFIGSNIVKGLNELGREDILVVDNLTNMVKFKNIQGLKVMDYLDKVDFIQRVRAGKFDHEPIEVIFHEGACSDTMEYNGKYMMENNFEYTKTLMHLPWTGGSNSSTPLLRPPTAAGRTDSGKNRPVRKP